MTYRGYTLSHVTRQIASCQVECVEIVGGGRKTWASTEAVAKRAVDAWEKTKTVASGGVQTNVIAGGQDGRKTSATGRKHTPTGI